MQRKYPLKEFIEYFRETRRSMNLQSVEIPLEAIRIAKRAYEEGGFGRVVSDLTEYQRCSRVRIGAKAIIELCDNWRYALEDIQTSISIAKRYAGETE